MRRQVLLAASAFLAFLSLSSGGAFADSKEEFLKSLSSSPSEVASLLSTCSVSIDCGSTTLSCTGTVRCIQAIRNCPSFPGGILCGSSFQSCPPCGVDP